MGLRFSVVLPTRGRSPFLGNAIASVLAGPTDLELLLVYDRRADEPDLDLPQLGDPRVRLLHSPAPGVSSARNFALDQARGEIVGFLDDDDWWLPGHLEGGASLLARHPDAIMIGADVRILTGDGSVLPGEVDRLPRLFPDRASGEVSMHDLLLANLFPICTVLCRRELLEPQDRFDPRLAHMEDYDLWLRLARRRAPIFDDQPRAVVRRHDRNASRDWRRMAESSLRVLGRVERDSTARDALSADEWRRRAGRLWHDLAYACLVDDDPLAARHAATEAVRRLPLMLKNYSYLVASGLPSALRRALVVRGRRTLHAS